MQALDIPVSVSIYSAAAILKALDIPVSVSIYSAAAILKALNIPVSVSIYSAAAILKARENKRCCAGNISAKAKLATLRQQPLLTKYFARLRNYFPYRLPAWQMRYMY